MARLREFYKDTVVPELIKQFGYKSVMEVPRIEKITLRSTNTVTVLSILSLTTLPCKVRTFLFSLIT